MRNLGRITWMAVCVAAVPLAGCGGSSTSTITTVSSAVPGSPAASADVSASSVDAVASVAGTPIAKAAYVHWLRVERADGAAANAGHRALSFLITSQWVIGEAAARKLAVSETEVKQHLAKLEQQSFPKAGALQKFLASSHETEADLLARVRVELLQSRIAAQVTAGKPAGQRTSILASFQKAFQRAWKGRTTCKAGYVMEDCSQYKGKPEDLAAPSSSSARSASTSAPSSSGSSASSSAPGSSGPSPDSSSSGTSASVEVSSRPGSFAITSPAFRSGGAIPSQYTCDGAGISPPLQWSNVPAKAVALVLLIVDTTAGRTGGVRWVVGDINPSSHGVAAGQPPPGGIVGSSSQGHSGYGGICPARGKTSTIQFVLYALSNKIPLSPGFQPSVAEQEYNAGKLVLSQAAITNATYHRP